MVVTIRGLRDWLYCGVATDVYILYAPLQSCRISPLPFLQCASPSKGRATTPRVMATDKLRSYPNAKGQIHA